MKSSLASNVRRRLLALKPVEIIVGVPSFNNEKTILSVLKIIDNGLSKYFPNSKSVIMVSDGDSTDSTLDIAFDKFKSKTSEKVCTTYRGASGKGMALRAIMEAARTLKSKVLMLFDADLKT